MDNAPSGKKKKDIATEVYRNSSEYPQHVYFLLFRHHFAILYIIPDNSNSCVFQNFPDSLEIRITVNPILIWSPGPLGCELGLFLRNSTSTLLFTSRTSASLRFFTSDNRYNHNLDSDVT